MTNEQHKDLYNYIRSVDPLNNDGVQVKYIRCDHVRIKQLNFNGNMTTVLSKLGIRRFDRLEFNEYCGQRDLSVTAYKRGIIKEIRKD